MGSVVLAVYMAHIRNLHGILVKKLKEKRD
jgi:hypothetical protein